MPEKRTQYYNANGVRRTLITDDERPGFVVQTEQNLDEILGGIARDRELTAVSDNQSPNRHLARLPVEVFERAVLEAWDEGDWRRYLNSFEAAPFRIWRGQV
jgi:hypothetical protein